MPAISHSYRPVERLILIPLLGALLLMWGTVATNTILRRGVVLAQVQSQLSISVATLADFNELAEVSSGEALTRAGESRSAAVWRTLLRYPSASIWVEKNGSVLAGQPPSGDTADYIQADDARNTFTVHAAMPLSDALADWHKSAWQLGVGVLFFSAIVAVLTYFLMRTVRQRAAAEKEAVAAEERATQLASYRTQLERTVAERTADLASAMSGLERAKSNLEVELVERRAAEKALREHDALLSAVTRSAAELLGAQHEDAIASVLGLIGLTLCVSRVQLTRIITDLEGHLLSSVSCEWCAPGAVATIDNPSLRDLDLTRCCLKNLAPNIMAEPVSFGIADISEAYRVMFEQAKLRSFLQIPVLVEEKFWGTLNFIDSATEPRKWSWAESDTLKTLAGLIGVAMTRARYVKELADANMIVQNSPTILYRLKGEPSLPLIYISHNITKFGHNPERLIGNSNWSQALIEPEDVPKVNAAMLRALEKDAQPATLEFRLRAADGAHHWVENRYTPVRDRNGRLSEVEGMIIDITERKAAEERIAHLARTDGLTGLANRTTFVEQLRQAFASSSRGAGPFAILYVDLDHFKDVNDTLGHPVGDGLLREVATRLRQATRDGDLIARLGGDEFAILQGHVGEPAAAALLAERIVRVLAAPYSIEGNEINFISASVGVCPYSSASASPDAMLAQADLALYRAKGEGRNQYRFHSDDLDREVLERVALAEDLRKALERGELELYYQPQVELTTGRITGMEALLRWHHPTRGLLAAGTFMQVAEKAGLTIALGNWVIDQACAQMRRWMDRDLAPPIVAINLSNAQLKNGRELTRHVQQCLTRWDIPAKRLEFDVTEAMLAQVTMKQSNVLQQLRVLGALIAIDDFGTEYSSFDYLHTYHVAHLKIAQSLVSRASCDPEVAATMRAIVNLARELRIGVIAVGVESEEQRRLLLETGSTASCQGYYFSAAVEVQQADDLLRRGSLGPLREDQHDVGTADLLTHPRVVKAQ